MHPEELVPCLQVTHGLLEETRLPRQMRPVHCHSDHKMMCADCCWSTVEKTINSVPADLGCLCKHVGLDTYGGLMGRTQTASDFLTITQSIGKEMHPDGFMFVNRMC